MFIGVRQGCNLSLLLFVLANDWVKKQASQGKGIQLTDEKNLPHLDFTDDIVALARSTQEIQLLVDDISFYAGNIGLVISAEKTKNMLAGEYWTPIDVFMDQKKVEEVGIFTYLGSFINSSGEILIMNWNARWQWHSNSWTNLKQEEILLENNIEIL